MTFHISNPVLIASLEGPRRCFHCETW